MNEIITELGVQPTTEQLAALMATANLDGAEVVDPATVEVVEGSFTQGETLH